jgi:hypothetical protein
MALSEQVKYSSVKIKGRFLGILVIKLKIARFEVLTAVLLILKSSGIFVVLTVNSY